MNRSSFSLAPLPARANAVLVLRLNAKATTGIHQAQRHTHPIQAAGRARKCRVLWVTEPNAETEVCPNSQGLEPLASFAVPRGGAVRVTEYPLSNAGDGKAPGLTWWPVEKLEGVRGRAAT